MKSKRSILKKAMGVKYFGATRFDFLDEEELPLIYKAMDDFAKDIIESISEQQIKNHIDKQPYYGHCTSEYKEGVDQGVKWLKSEQLKKLKE